MNSIIDHARDTEDYPINETYTTTFEWDFSLDVEQHILMQEDVHMYHKMLARWQ